MNQVDPLAILPIAVLLPEHEDGVVRGGDTRRVESARVHIIPQQLVNLNAASATRLMKFHCAHPVLFGPHAAA